MWSPKLSIGEYELNNDILLELGTVHGAHYGQYGEFRRFIINMP